MPRPRYIICAETRIVDQTSGLCSYCNVIDGLTVNMSAKPREVDAKERLAQFFRMFVSAVWVDENATEKDRDYEYETTMMPPGRQEPRVIAKGHFRFTKPSHRIETALAFPLGPSLFGDSPETGILLIANRIREVNAKDWLVQEFPIVVTVRRLDAEKDAATLNENGDEKRCDAQG